MKEFNESRLKFTFDKNWKVFKLDENIDCKLIKKLDGTKDVDFLGILKENIYFIEVKNFRNYMLENQDKLKNFGNSLMIEVAQKVKDSLACIIGGKRNSIKDKLLWNNILNFVNDEQKVINVILWLELDNIENQDNNIRNLNQNKRNIVNNRSYESRLKEKLNWLTNDVIILNTESYKNNLNFKVIK